MSGRLPNQADEPALMIEKRQCVAYITLNRETSLNAINNEIRDTFPKLLAQLDRARDVRAVVITGSGSRAFCVGADIKELRAPEYDGGTIWFGVTGPAGVPTGIVNKLNSEFNMALRLPEIRQKIEQNLGYEIVGGSPQDFIAQLSNEIRKMKQIAKQAGIVPQ